MFTVPTVVHQDKELVHNIWIILQFQDTHWDKELTDEKGHALVSCDKVNLDIQMDLFGIEFWPIPHLLEQLLLHLM